MKFLKAKIMSINKDDPFSEAIQLKKAKRRLIGAIIIFVFLLVLSIFFIEDRSLLNEKDLKISFIDENNHPIDEIIDEVSSEISSSSYYIQVGIFSDLMKTKQLSENIKKKGVDCNIDKLQIKDKEMYRIKTISYESFSDAEKILEILQSNKVGGIIKKNNNL